MYVDASGFKFVELSSALRDIFALFVHPLVDIYIHICI